MNEALNQRLRSKSDAHLFSILLEDAGDYSDEAKNLARSILAERGLDEESERERRKSLALLRRQERDAVVAASRAAERERRAALEQQARAETTCLVCKRAAPETRRVVRLAKPEGREEVSNQATIEHWSVTELPIYVCQACDEQTRIRGLRGSLWFLAIPILLASLAVLVFFAFSLLKPGMSIPGWMSWAVPLSAAPIGALAIGGWRNQRRLRRLAHAHPLGPKLLAAGHRPTSERFDKETELLFVGLRSSDRGVRATSEQRLVAAGGSAVIATALAHLEDSDIGPACIRVLSALQAEEAVDALTPLLEHKNREIRQEVERALASFGFERRDLPKATVITGA